MKALRWIKCMYGEGDDDVHNDYYLKIGEISIELSDNALYFNDECVGGFPSLTAAKRYARKWLVQLHQDLGKALN